MADTQAPAPNYQLQKPTCGRVVHYFPHESEMLFSGQTVVPAIVQDNDIFPTLSVFTGDDRTPVVVLKSVSHKSARVDASKGGYWDWPEIKKPGA